VLLNLADLERDGRGKLDPHINSTRIPHKLIAPRRNVLV
jgi:hypothetical protein